MPEFIEPISVENAIDQNASIFEGHPAEGEIEDKFDKPDEKVEEPEEKQEEPEEKKPAFKYVSHEAAEDAYKEAESLIGKSTAEAKRERERADDLQKQLNESLLKVTATSADPEPAKPTSTDKMKDLLDQVNLLDPEDENYHSKVAAIWGQREDEMQGNIDTKVKEALDVYDKRVKEKQDKADDELSTQKTIMSDAELAGKEAGLDMKKGSDDSEMFWAFADKSPEGTIEDQIKWTVDKVVKLKTAYAAPGITEKEKTLEAEKKAKANQEQNSVLERGGYKPAEKVVPEVPLGLATAFTQIERRI